MHLRRGSLYRVLGALPLLCLTAGSGWAGTNEERDLGRSFDLQARARLPLLHDADVSRYVDQIGRRIVAHLGEQPFEYQFTVVRDARLNAFAVPGGYIYVHGGLLTRIGNDDELAGVLGHEIAHVHAHHLVRQQEATELLGYAALLGALLTAVQPAAGLSAMALHSATQLKYRREFEQEADYLGLRYMRQAGFAPHGMLDFLKKMLDEQRSGPSTTAPSYLSSHPLSDQRLTHLEATLKTHQGAGGTRNAPSLALERTQVVVRARSELADSVLAHYRRRVDADRADGRARYLLGLAMLETGAYASARETLLGARAAGFTAVHRELGRTALAMRDLDTARQQLEEAVALDPDDALAHFALAHTRQALGDSEAALQELRRTVQLAPTMEEAHYDLGMLAGRSGDEGEGLYHLGVALQLRGEPENALNQFERALQHLQPETSEAAAAQSAITNLRGFLGRK